jgi:nucleoside-diphosphate-sugar epimerase
VEPEVLGKGTPHAEADRLQVDSTAIRRELGWRPRWTLDEGLRKAYAWYERHWGAHAASAGRAATA